LRSLLLHHVELMSLRGVLVMGILENPVLDKGAAIREDDTIVGALDGGLRLRGGDNGGRCRRALRGGLTAGGWRRRGALHARILLRSLLLGLLRGRGGRGLLEILKTENDGEAEKHDEQHGLHAAATAAAAAAARTALRLQIGILEFGQRLHPVFQTRGRPKSAAVSMVMVRGRCDGAMRGLAPGRVRPG
jgi:hypothetical protein